MNRPAACFISGLAHVIAFLFSVPYVNAGGGGGDGGTGLARTWDGPSGDALEGDRDAGTFSVGLREEGERVELPSEVTQRSIPPPELNASDVEDSPASNFDAFTYSAEGEGATSSAALRRVEAPPVPPELRRARLLPAGTAGRAGAGGGRGGGIGGGVGESLGPGDGPAQGVFTPAPVYPPSARLRGREGLVKVEIRVSEDGTCRVDRVLESEGGESFEDAVRRAVARWRYRPATCAGRPSSDLLVIRFLFRIEN